MMCRVLFVVMAMCWSLGAAAQTPPTGPGQIGEIVSELVTGLTAAGESLLSLDTSAAATAVGNTTAQTLRTLGAATPLAPLTDAGADALGQVFSVANVPLAQLDHVLFGGPVPLPGPLPGLP